MTNTTIANRMATTIAIQTRAGMPRAGPALEPAEMGAGTGTRR